VRDRKAPATERERRVRIELPTLNRDERGSQCSRSCEGIRLGRDGEITQLVAARKEFTTGAVHELHSVQRAANLYASSPPENTAGIHQ